MMWESVWLIVVALLWGSTNPLMRKGGKGIEDVKRKSKLAQFFAEVKFLLLNWKVRKLFTSLRPPMLYYKFVYFIFIQRFVFLVC